MANGEHKEAIRMDPPRLDEDDSLCFSGVRQRRVKDGCYEILGRRSVLDDLRSGALSGA